MLRQLQQLLALLYVCCRREMWSSYGTYKTWQTLLSTTRKQSHDHSVLADIYGNVMVSRLSDLMDDMQRVHKKVKKLRHISYQTVSLAEFLKFTSVM